MAYSGRERLGSEGVPEAYERLMVVESGPESPHITTHSGVAFSGLLQAVPLMTCYASLAGCSPEDVAPFHRKRLVRQAELLVPQRSTIHLVAARALDSLPAGLRRQQEAHMRNLVGQSNGSTKIKIIPEAVPHVPVSNIEFVGPLDSEDSAAVYVECPIVTLNHDGMLAGFESRPVAFHGPDSPDIGNYRTLLGYLASQAEDWA